MVSFKLSPFLTDSQTVGWGYTQNNEPSRELLTTNLPYVDFQTCWTTVPETFQSYVTRDKFCAGYQNGECYIHVLCITRYNVWIVNIFPICTLIYITIFSMVPEILKNSKFRVAL
jgi:hypothetical protein